MSKLVSFFRSLLGSAAPTSPAVLPSSTFRDFTCFVEGDRVLVNGVKLLDPLKKGRTTEWKHNIRHDDIIGKQSAGRLKVTSPKGASLTVEHPTFDQFVSMSPRHVTPIYAPYAAFIVNQLDLHPSPSTSNSPRVEILEAGTGHGSLTLHIARAIAAANPSPPDAQYPRMPQASFATTMTAEQARLAEVWEKWKETRNAIVHTVEFSDVHSRAAEKLIRSFRQGLYWPHIDFSVGDVGAWVTAKLAERKSPFLNSVILDVPSVHQQLPRVIAVIQTHGRLVVFAASITQLCECERIIDEQKLQLVQEKVLELGSGISDGRVWNVRLTVPRRNGSSAAPESNAEGKFKPMLATTPEKVMICRPKVGEKLVGGGFIGVWRKTDCVP